MSNSSPIDKKFLIIFGACAVVLFSIGVIIGYYGKQGEYNNRDLTESEKLLIKHVSNRFANEQALIGEMLESVNSSLIREYHKTLTVEPHIAGLKRDKELTEYIRQAWTEMGFENIHLAEYDFYLSFPNQTNPNKIYLLDENSKVRFTSKHMEEEVRTGDSHPNFVHAFNAYAPAGDVTGELVYVNYGRVEDLAELEILNVNVSGKICIARYGLIFRGNKVFNCQDRGAIGVILFSDPHDVAPFGTNPIQLYPNTMFLPGSGIQRGSTSIGNGDPLSPDWASVPNAHRIKASENKWLPSIPAQPIGYDDAKKLLEKMAGPASPTSWKGKIQGVEYRLGGEMLADWKVRLVVNNYCNTVKSSNVIASITGEVEPDRYVIIGNHRDAWGFGGVDPSSGTAVVMEIARLFGELVRQGWRPRRSILFCNWAAEEHGLGGSYEWVYENKDKIVQRAVGVLNIDSCVSGTIPDISTSPVLQDVMMDALKHASDPTTNLSRSYYDFWEEWTVKYQTPKPEFNLLASGTDHAAFAFYAGIPAINLHFRVDKKKHDGVLVYPAYHTGYDTFYLVDKIIDPGYKIHKSCAQSSVRVIMNLADSLFLPYNLKRFPEQMKKSLDKIRSSNVTRELFEKNNVTLRHLSDAVSMFEKATEQFMTNLAKANIRNPMEIRIINDQLMQLERVFLMDEGIPLRPEMKNAVFAPQKFNKYGGAAFPAIYDLLYQIERLEGQTLENRWEQIRRHLSDLMIMVQSAAKFLAPVDEV